MPLRWLERIMPQGMLDTWAAAHAEVQAILLARESLRRGQFGDGPKPGEGARSPKWPALRKRFLEEHPKCELCGGTAKLEAHHIQPFHLFPSRELDPTNLIALCENKRDGVNCHLLFGHLGNFQSYNRTCVADVSDWAFKIEKRP